MAPIIGRDRELDALHALLTVERARLVTLTGPGGVGKTRLAIEAAARSADAFELVRFVELDAISDAVLAVDTIAHALSPSSGGTLADALRGRVVLLVLDNLEQVDGAASFVADLLAASDGLTVLATSREPLRLYGERRFPVEPLPVPGDDAHGASDAVGLFVERASAVRPGFRPEGIDARAVAGICRRLDGLPLAIELAAARVNLLPPRDMLRRLERPLGLLVGGPRDAPERHRTMRAAIAWSVDLLDDAQNDVFRRLAVFVGGCTLEAAEAVCGCPSGDILEHVSALLDRSLLRREEGPGGEPRFTMLSTIRDYAQEALDAGDDRAIVAGRYRAWFEGFARDAAARLVGPDQAIWLDRLEADHGNLRAVIDAVEPGVAAELAVCLAGFWQIRGHLAEGRRRLESAAAAYGARDVVRARVLRALGALEYQQGDGRAAAGHFSESLDLAGELGDEATVGGALKGLGDVDHIHGNLERAATYMEESLAIARRMGDDAAAAAALNTLGVVAKDAGDRERARRLFEEALALRRGLGDMVGTAVTLNNLGADALDRGDLDAAHRLLDESLHLCRALGDTPGIAATLLNLGAIAFFRGDLAQARTGFQESLVLSRELGRRGEVAGLLGNLGELARMEGDLASARRLFEEAREVRRELGDERGVPVEIGHLAAVAHDDGDLDGARALYEEAAARARRHDDLEQLAGHIEGLAWVDADAGKAARARDRFEAAIRLARDVGDARIAARCRVGLGRLDRESGDPGTAASRYEEALDVLERSGDPEALAECLIGMAAVAASRGDVERAALLAGAAEHLGLPRGAFVRRRRERELEPMRRLCGEAQVEAARALGWREAVRRARTATQPVVNEFRREGDGWTISYEGTAVRLRDMRGLRYLAALLAAPNREVHCLDLANPDDAPAHGHAGEVVDDRARDAYRARIRELSGEIEAARLAGDAEAEDRARAEVEAITGALASAHGLGGRPRKAADTSERARKAVGKCIRDAMTRIGEVHPELWLHLSSTIRLGTFCEYRPGGPATWRT